MIDMHSHILPGIDDGAKNVKISLQLIEKDLRDGIKTICLTPHFNFEKQTIEQFLQEREDSYQQLKQAVEQKGWNVEFILGAEVAFSTKLTEQQDLKRLCYGNGKCMLVELPVTYLPKWTEEVLDELQVQGITPLLAHVERYNFFQSAPDKLYGLLEDGCYAQVNATSIVKHKNAQKLIFLLMKHGMVHCMGSDTHSMEKRPPMMQDAMNLIEKKMGSEYLKNLEKNGLDLVTKGKLVKRNFLKPIRSIFGYYF